MGGIINDNKNSGFFCKITNDVITRKPKEHETETITEIEVFNPSTKEVQEKEVVIYKGGINGNLVGLVSREFKIEGTNQKIESLNVILDDGERWFLDIKKGSPYWTDLINRLWNLYNQAPEKFYNTNLTLKPVAFEQENKLYKKRYMNLYVGGESVKGFFGKDNPAPDRAKWTKIKVKGVESWDNSGEIEFYSEILKQMESVLETESGLKVANDLKNMDKEDNDVF